MPLIPLLHEFGLRFSNAAIEAAFCNSVTVWSRFTTYDFARFRLAEDTSLGLLVAVTVDVTIHSTLLLSISKLFTFRSFSTFSSIAD